MPMLSRHIIFSEQPSVSSVDLPLTLISLEEWILIKVHGRDTIQYLHNQFTCDIKNLNDYQYSFAAHCNPKGKMISNMYVFRVNDQEIAFIERLNICKKQIAAMKKYAVFSDIYIIPDYKSMLIGVAGKNSREYLNTFFSVLPNKINTVVHNKDITLLYFDIPIERFLLIITNYSVLDQLLNQSKFCVQFNNSRQWVALDIEANYPLIESVTSELFIPQACNIDILEGISFNKGCYIGQEAIVRIQYSGYNKQVLCRLTGILNYNESKKLPKSGDHVEGKINDQYWKNIGIVLQSCQIKKNNVWVQTVLHKSFEKKSQLRIKNTQNNNNLVLFIK